MKVSFSLISPDGQFWSEESLFAEGEGLGERLDQLKPLYGQLEIFDDASEEGTAISDDFDFMMYDICIGMIPKLAAGEDVDLTLAAHNEEVSFSPSGGQVEIAGSAIPEITVDRAALLDALVACGGRYLDLKRAELDADESALRDMDAALASARAAL